MENIKYPIFKAIVVLSVLGAFSHFGYASDSGDFQYWNSNEIEWKPGDDWKVSVTEDLRFGNGASRFYYHHTDMGLGYSGMAKWLDIRSSYRLIFTKGDKEWKQENRAYLDAVLKYDIFDLRLSDRNRFEYRKIEDKEDNWRYRNRLTVKYPINFNNAVFSPYVSDEIFLDLSSRAKLTRNRFYSGLEVKILKNFTADVYYLYQSTKGKSGWTDLNVLGTKLKISF